MRIIRIGILNPEQKNAVYRLWNKEYPLQLQHATIADLNNYLNGLSKMQHYLLENDSNQILGWAFRFTRDNQPWFAIILDDQIHGQGYGTALLNELKKGSKELNGWVIYHNKDLKENGKNYRSPLGFYLKNDFVVFSGIKLDSKKITAVKIQWKSP